MDRNDLLLAARTEFLRAFTESLDESIRQAEAHLFVKADTAKFSADQRRYLDARVFVMKSAATIRMQILQAMERLLQRSFQTAYNAFRPSFSWSGSGLSLVETAAFEGELRIDEFTKRFRDEAEDELRDLNIRIALLFEQEDISERENPFRPYLISRSVASAFETMELPPDDVDALIVQISEGMCGRIAVIYSHLNELLAAQGLAAQLQLKIRKMPSRLNLGSASAGTDAGPATENAQAPGQTPHTSPGRHQPHVVEVMPSQAKNPVDDLFERIRDFGSGATALDSSSHSAPSDSAAGTEALPPPPAAGRSEPDRQHRRSWLNGLHSAGQVLRQFFAGPAMPSATTDDVFDVNPPHALPANTPLTDSIQDLQREATPAAHEMLGSEGQVRNLILEERERLSDLARDSNEQMIIDIVAMLFEFILRDAQVPAEVRAQLGRLQFLVLKIALLDPELFSKEYHDVRMLVNRIGSISLGLRQIDPSGERVSAEICRIVETLLADETQGVALFGLMLDELDAFVARELLAADHQVDRAVQAVAKAESRTLQFARISAMLSEALSHIRVDQYLHDFLVNTWSRVVERAGREHPQSALRFRVLVPDLIWSVAPKVLPEERQQLIKQVPGMIATLGEGLVLIGWPQGERHVLMAWLMDAHRDALRATHVPMPVPPLAMLRERFADFIAAPVDETPSSMQDRELDHALLHEAIGELEASLNVMDQHLGVESEIEDLSDAATDELVFHTQLKAGVMIEVNLDGLFKPARLNWVGEGQERLILSIEGHDVPSMVSLRAFRRLLAGGRARFAEEAQVFERAVRQLLDTADQTATH